MAGAKKKKKPAANPARGFATTSVASSKARTEPALGSENAIKPQSAIGGTAAVNASAAPSHETPSVTPQPTTGTSAAKTTLTPEDYEKQLEEDELQLLVEKYAQKTKRDVQRQRTRLETDRRLLRGQADPVNHRKWLPQELMDQVLDLIQAESRFASSSVSSESIANGRMLPEEDMTIKLWTLQQTLASVGFPHERVQSAMRYILDIAPNIPAPKDSLWGLEEAFDWLARECPGDELPDYEGRGRQGGKNPDNSTESSVPSGASTPRTHESDSRNSGLLSKMGASSSQKKKAAVTYDSDIEPDDLVPTYLETKSRLYELERGQQGKKGQSGDKAGESSEETEIARLHAKIDRIEKDVLFDKLPAEQKWKAQKIMLERQFAAAKKQLAQEGASRELEREVKEPAAPPNEDVNDEAARIAAEILAEEHDDDDDGAIANLFANLPMTEVDASG